MEIEPLVVEWKRERDVEDLCFCGETQLVHQSVTGAASEEAESAEWRATTVPLELLILGWCLPGTSIRPAPDGLRHQQLVPG